MASPTLDHLLQLAASLGLGGAAVKGLELLARRRGAERREPANMTRAAAELSRSLSEGSTALLHEFREEFSFLRGRVADLQDQVDAANRRAVSALEEHANCKIEVEGLKAEIVKLMSGRVARVGEIDPHI